MYPQRHQLHEVTAHLLGVLERRRAGVTEWSAAVEQSLADEAKDTLAEAGRQFAEVADDKPYWNRLEESVREVVLPRYFKIAKEEQQAEKDKYGLWRGGDLVSRVAYAMMGLIGAAIVWRTAIPDYLEPLPLGFFLGGPLIPDLQVWFARRKFQGKLRALVEDMKAEAEERAHYRPMLDAVDPGPAQSDARPADATKEKS